MAEGFGSFERHGQSRSSPSLAGSAPSVPLRFTLSIRVENRSRLKCIGAIVPLQTPLPLLNLFRLKEKPLPHLHGSQGSVMALVSTEELAEVKPPDSTTKNEGE